MSIFDIHMSYWHILSSQSQGLLRHAKARTTLGLYSQAIDESKLAAQRDIARAITGSQPQAA